jgi:prophage tail gpP-like protein
VSDNRRDRDSYTAPSATTNTALGGPADGELVLKAAGQIIAGWLDVTVTRSVDTVPGTFHIMASSPPPASAGPSDNRRDRDSYTVPPLVPINSPLTIEIGGHTVLTGYLDATTMSIGPEEHITRYQGRGRLRDIVDCSVQKDNISLLNTTITKLAAWLVEGFAGPIQVVAPDGDGDGKAFDFAADLGDTPYEAISRVARYEGLLVYENEAGNLVLSRVGDVTHASGFAEGKNIQSAEFTTDFSERFSTYRVMIISIDQLARSGALQGPVATDPAITTYRPRVIISEQATSNATLAAQRALWEAQRRRGRSTRVTLVCDSWLDSAGTPWTPNQLAPVSIPSLGLDTPGWVIAGVTFKRDGRSGTTAQVTLMPAEALTIEPITLNPYEQRALTSGQPTSPTGPAGTSTGNDVTAPNALPSVATDRRPVSVTQGSGL